MGTFEIIELKVRRRFEELIKNHKLDLLLM